MALNTIPFSKGDPTKLFNLDFILDEGAFGTVWRGTLKHGDADVAIKMMPLREEVVEELTSEINFLKQFDSPYVVHYFGTWLHQKSQEIWIAMELAELGSIEGIMLYCEYDFTEEQLAALFARILLGLEYVHSKGLVHQDIKAKNILLKLNGEVKLADFGVAATMSNVNQGRGTVSGSPHWMAPEILLGEEITQKCDVWSLGITVIELVDGEPPFADIPPISVIQIIPERAAPTLPDAENASNDFVDFLARLCEKNPKERWTAKQLLDHPFVCDEVDKAGEQDNKLLQALAEECYDVVQSTREDFEGDALMENNGNHEEDGSVEEYSDYEDYSDSSEDSSPVMISNKGGGAKLKIKGKGRSGKSRKSKDSFYSVVVDDDHLKAVEDEEKNDLRERLRRKQREKALRKGSVQSKRTRGFTGRKHTRHTRMTRHGGRDRGMTERTKSMVSIAYRPGTAINNIKLSPKASMRMQNRKNLQFNMADLRRATKINSNATGEDAAQHEETVKKAQQLLARLQNLTGKKQL